MSERHRGSGSDTSDRLLDRHTPELPAAASRHSACPDPGILETTRKRMAGAVSNPPRPAMAPTKSSASRGTAARSAHGTRISPPVRPRRPPALRRDPAPARPPRRARGTRRLLAHAGGDRIDGAFAAADGRLAEFGQAPRIAEHGLLKRGLDPPVDEPDRQRLLGFDPPPGEQGSLARDGPTSSTSRRASAWP